MTARQKLGSLAERVRALRGKLPPPLKRRLQALAAWLYRSRHSLRANRAGEGARVAPGALEGVVILGMHRSGTSLVTRLVSLLGLALCREDDLLVGRKANPRGHWESRSLLDFDDRLLEELGGAWFCPPLLGERELARSLRRRGAEALARLGDAHPRRPWVWKDPRASVLLAFWSAVLAQRAAYVLVVRHPLEVSDSLARRDGFAPALSLALWERYTRQAMLGAAGRPTMVCTYDRVLADPLAFSERLLAFLGELGLPLDGVDRAALGAFAMEGLRHSQRSWTELGEHPAISSEQGELARLASELVVERAYVPPQLPPETPSTEAIFQEVRAQLASRGAAGARSRLPARLRAPIDGEASRGARPPVSIVLVGDTGDQQASATALAGTLPPGSETLLVAGWDGLEAKLPAARGEIVLLCGAPLARCEQWFEPFKQALSSRRVVAVSPVLRSSARPELPPSGLAFSDEDLRMGPRVLERSPEPVAAALLSSAFCALNRRVLAAAGGVDGGFSSPQASMAELSVRLWRMGFHCRIVGQVQVWREADPGEDAGVAADLDDAELYDRLRIAALHLGGERLRAFTARARQLPSYRLAAERLAASDVERRRAALAAVCAFPIERYFERFALPPASASSV
jgi:hypothetical protein